MKTYFYLCLLALFASIVGWNREGTICFAAIMFLLWLCRKTLAMRF